MSSFSAKELNNIIHSCTSRPFQVAYFFSFRLSDTLFAFLFPIYITCTSTSASLIWTAEYYRMMVVNMQLRIVHLYLVPRYLLLLRLKHLPRHTALLHSILRHFPCVRDQVLDPSTAVYILHIFLLAYLRVYPIWSAVSDGSFLNFIL